MDELVEMFLKLTVKTVQVHLIIGTILEDGGHVNATKTARDLYQCICMITRLKIFRRLNRLTLKFFTS